jgi:outer membrane biosynthesis protein TonB
MKELHALVDFENVQPGMEDLLKIAPKLTDVWLFHGPNQTKRAKQVKAAHERVTLVPHTGKGKNALDFHLSFYLGYVAARHPDATLVVVANDKGYDSMLSHAKLLGFTARRVGFKAKKAPAVKAAAPAKKTPVKKAAVKKTVATEATPAPAQPAVVAVPLAQKTPAQKVSAKKAPAKKVAAKKAPAKKTPAKQPAAKKAATKKVTPKKTPAKKTPAKAVPAKKAPAKAAPATKAAAPKAKPKARPTAPPPSGSKAFIRLKTGLTQMGDKRPRKLASFLRHVQAILGKDSPAAAVEAAVRELERAKVVHIAGDLVLYS